jgi:hypothetical protein
MKVLDVAERQPLRPKMALAAMLLTAMAVCVVNF